MPVDIHDDFFALGGDSVLAAKLAARVSHELGLAVPIQMVLEQPTVAEMVEAVLFIDPTPPPAGALQR